MSANLLIDNSAWARLGHPALATERSEEIASELEAGRIGFCLPFLMEAGCSARSAAEHGEILAELRSLPFVAIDERIERRALDAHRQPARVTIAFPPSTSSLPRSPRYMVSGSFTTTATTN